MVNLRLYTRNISCASLKGVDIIVVMKKNDPSKHGYMLQVTDASHFRDVNFICSMALLGYFMLKVVLKLEVDIDNYQTG